MRATAHLLAAMLETFALCPAEKVKLQTSSSRPREMQWKRREEVWGCRRRGMARSKSSPGNSGSLQGGALTQQLLPSTGDCSYLR